MVLRGEAQKHSFETKKLENDQKYLKSKRIRKKIGFKIIYSTTFLNDSAWFCVEKLKKHDYETKQPEF